MKRKQIQIKTLAKHEQATSHLELSHEIEQFKFKPNTHTHTLTQRTHITETLCAHSLQMYCSFRFVTLRLFAR